MRVEEGGCCVPIGMPKCDRPMGTQFSDIVLNGRELRNMYTQLGPLSLLYIRLKLLDYQGGQKCVFFLNPGGLCFFVFFLTLKKPLNNEVFQCFLCFFKFFSVYFSFFQGFSCYIHTMSIKYNTNNFKYWNSTENWKRKLSKITLG